MNSNCLNSLYIVCVRAHSYYFGGGREKLHACTYMDLFHYCIQCYYKCDLNLIFNWQR